MNSVFDPGRHHRRSIRLPGFDYTQPGRYFVTICIQDRQCLLGNIVDGVMQLNNAGAMIMQWWQELSRAFQVVRLDAFVIMPNHVHGIIGIGDLVGATLCGRPSGNAATAMEGATTPGATTQGCPYKPALGDMVGWFKTMTTNAYIDGVKKYGWPVFRKRLWQKNYYEHIIRTQALCNSRGPDEITRIHQYIVNNPRHWSEDKHNPVFRPQEEHRQLHEAEIATWE